MTELTSKQKKHLRGLGQRIGATASVGKAGASDGVIGGINTMLELHELVKVHIPAGSSQERTAMASELAQRTGAELIALVGRMVLLYRANEDLPRNRRIGFPG